MTFSTIPRPWYRQYSLTAEAFLLGMLNLGKPIELSYVGVFDEAGRGSRRDIELPLHRDGEYSAKLAAAQGGEYVEKPGIDYVGLYCLRESSHGDGDCLTILQDGERTIEVSLRKGDALVFDNRKVLHGRRGQVGDRLLLRAWISETPIVKARSAVDTAPGGWRDT